MKASSDITSSFNGYWSRQFCWSSICHLSLSPSIFFVLLSCPLLADVLTCSLHYIFLYLILVSRRLWEEVQGRWTYKYEKAFFPKNTPQWCTTQFSTVSWRCKDYRRSKPSSLYTGQMLKSLVSSCLGGEACPHPVPVEDWGSWTKGESVWDETLEWSVGDQHAAWTCCSTLPRFQEKRWGESLMCTDIRAVLISHCV